MIARSLFFVGIVFLGLFMPLWVFLGGATPYILLYGGYEMFLVAVVIDFLFGAGGVVYGFLYTLTTGMLTLVALLLRPSMRFNE